MSQLTLSDFLSEEDLDGLNRPSAEARGLPGRAYSDVAFFELERRHYFPKTWMAAAFRSDLPNPGDVLPVTMAGFELLFMRDQQGKIRCFHNVCRHRGNKLVTEPKSCVKSLQCGWHSWTYDLQGKLIATPRIGGPGVNEVEGFNQAKLGLLPVSCDEWFNFIFINLDGKAGPLKDHLKPVMTRLQSYDLSLLRPSEIGFEKNFDGNWKILVEAAVEDYHVPWVHPQMVMETEFRPELGGRCYAGISNRRRMSEARGRHAQTAVTDVLPIFPHLNGVSELETYVLILVPTAVLVVWPHHVATRIYMPESYDRSRVRSVFLFIGDAATSSHYAKVREQIGKSWAEIGRQDAQYIAEVHNMSRIRAELSMETRFSPYWEPAVHHFQKLVVDELRS